MPSPLRQPLIQTQKLSAESHTPATTVDQQCKDIATDLFTKSNYANKLSAKASKLLKNIMNGIQPSKEEYRDYIESLAQEYKSHSAIKAASKLIRESNNDNQSPHKTPSQNNVLQADKLLQTLRQDIQKKKQKENKETKANVAALLIISTNYYSNVIGDLAKTTCTQTASAYGTLSQDRVSSRKAAESQTKSNVTKIEEGIKSAKGRSSQFSFTRMFSKAFTKTKKHHKYAEEQIKKSNLATQEDRLFARTTDAIDQLLKTKAFEDTSNYQQQLTTAQQQTKDSEEQYKANKADENSRKIVETELTRPNNTDSDQRITQLQRDARAIIDQNPGTIKEYAEEIKEAYTTSTNLTARELKLNKALDEFVKKNKIEIQQPPVEEQRQSIPTERPEPTTRRAPPPLAEMLAQLEAQRARTGVMGGIAPPPISQPDAQLLPSFQYAGGMSPPAQLLAFGESPPPTVIVAASEGTGGGSLISPPEERTRRSEQQIVMM